MVRELSFAVDALQCHMSVRKQQKGFYTHFRNKNSLHLLAKTPEVLYSMDVSKSRPDALNKSYGVVATAAINEFGRQVYNTWLRKQAV